MSTSSSCNRPHGRLALPAHGARGLWLADASVMPAAPRANTSLPTLMIGERVADFLKSEI
jgi:choline dehydrogenase-like flavoprotein